MTIDFPRILELISEAEQTRDAREATRLITDALGILAVALQRKQKQGGA